MNTEDERITVTFYTGKENCFQISDMALKAMGNPTYAQVLINPITHQMLLMGTNEKRPNSNKKRIARKDGCLLTSPTEKTKSPNA